MISFLSAAASGISRLLSEGVRMMATAHPASSSLLPLLESLEDSGVGQEEQTDAYLTIANRLSGEDGKHFLPAVVKHFSRLGKVFQAHIVSPNVELSQAALQALGFCVFHSTIVTAIPACFMEEILVALNSIVVKSTDKNTCTRALWVMSKQNFPSEVVARKVPDVLKTLEAVRSREDLQSVIMEHEALNVVIRLLEQTPSPMGEGAVQWVKLVIPLVVHSASKVRLRAAAALEMGMPLLLQKQQEVAAVIEPLMSSKLIPELQKLFSSKNESNVLKLWPLFVRLLGKLLHRGGPFINSLLHLEELGFRSSSPIIKKIAFIAWKSLIDNFALNPEILCSAKRLKLLMQPLSSIQVRTEALLLTKLEVWWYLVVRLGSNLAVNFEQVGVPLLQITVSTESTQLSVSTPSRNSSQNTTLTTPKAGGHAFSSTSSTPRLALNSSSSVGGSQPAFPSIQLLGLEMLLHYFLGSEVMPTAAKNKLQLSLEPLTHPLITSPSSFTKHSTVLISAVRDSFIGIGKDAPEAMITLVWKSLIGFVTAAMETAGSKKDRPGSEVLTLLLQALESIVSSEALPAQRTLGLLEATVKGIPRKILGSAAYQVANMDVLNGTPALFLILLFHHSSVLPSFISDERFFLCLETLVGCGLSGPASPLAFSESVLGVMSRNAEAIQKKEHLWRMWSIVVNPLTDTITQTNEVNQGDALEHNFAAVHCALMFPVTHLVIGHTLPQMTQKSLLSTWSRLYKAFARCSALVATAEENVCCEELCVKMAAVLEDKVLLSPSTLEAVASLLLIVIECVDFSPYTPHYQKTKSPHTPLGWVRKKNKALGNLTTFQALLVQVLESFLSQDAHETLTEGTAVPSSGSAPGTVLIAILSTLFSNLVLGTAVLGALSALSEPLARLYEHAGRPPNEQPKSWTGHGPKLEKLLGEILGCLQTRSPLAYNDELLALLTPLLCVLFPHRSKQLRTLVTQFWNATFANAHTLTYPEDLKPVLSQVKQKMPIILPGFQAVDVPEDNSGQYSSESSQMETHVSGVKITSVGKRDSLLSREKGSNTLSKPIAVKLDFGSPKPPRRELLEEEASMDFVFIPPETKERVLTEHQKEVKRTKRVDIPAMYNNLDASLDTTVFTQYSQSQEDTMDKQPARDEPAETSRDEDSAEVQDEKMETEEAPEPDIRPIQEDMDVGSVADSTGDEAGKEEGSVTPNEVEPKSDHDPPKQDDLQAEMTSETRETSGDDCNVSASSDVVSGTPPKPNSRRQTFITLEKYMEGKAASPISATKFTGPLSRASNSQDASHSQEKGPASQVTCEASAGVEAAQELGNGEQQVSSQLEEKIPKEKEDQPHPPVEEVGQHRRESTEDEDDVIPDTQAEVDSADTGKREVKASVEDNLPTQDEDSCADSMYDSCEDGYLNDSQCSQVSSSQVEIRRSGRRRSRPLRPGEDRQEVEGRYRLNRRNSTEQGMSPSDLAKPDPLPAGQLEGQSQGRPGRRSKIAVEAQEVEVKEKLRKTRADSQTASSQASQNDSQSLGRVTRSRSSGPAEEEMSKSKSQVSLSTHISQTDSQSQGRLSRRSKVGGSAEEMSQTDSQMASSKPVSKMDSQSQERPSRRCKVSGPSEEMSQFEAQMTLTPVSQTDSQSQGRQNRRSKVSGPSDKISQSDTQAGLSTPVSQMDSQSQGRRSRRSKALEPSEEMSQSGAEMSLSTPASQTDGQPQGRPSRSSKVSGPSEEMSQSDAQDSLSTPVCQTDVQSQGRPSRRSKALEPSEEMSQSDAAMSLSTPASQTDGQPQGRPSRSSKASGPSEEMSQSDAQDSSSTPVCQTDVQSQGRPSRRSKALEPSEEMSQSDAEMSLSTPASQTDGLPQGRPSRSSKASGPSEEMSQSDAQDSSSTPVCQTDVQSQGRLSRKSKALEPSEEMSQSDAEMSLSTPASQTDGQPQSRPSRSSKASGPSEEMSQSDAQDGSSTPVCQTDVQSQGRLSRKSKALEPSEEMSQSDAEMSLSTPASQTDGQRQGRPSRSSKASGPSEEMSQSDAQDSSSTPVCQTDVQSQGRPSRRSKALEPSEEMSQSDAEMSLSTPASQTDGQPQGRPSRSSKVSGPSEEMSQSDAQDSLSTPVCQTDLQSQGRPSRRSKALEPSEEMSQSDAEMSLSTPASQTDGQPQGRPSRSSKASGPSEELSQSDAQDSLSTPVCQTDVQSQGRPSRRSKALEPSETMRQTDKPMTLSTSASPANSQPQGRPTRSRKVSDPSVPMSQTGTQTSLSTPVNQEVAQSQRRLSRSKVAGTSAAEMSQSNAQITLSTPASQTDCQSQGRPSRRSKVSGLSEEMSQSDAQMSLFTPVSQTDTHSQGRPSRRSKALEPSKEMRQSDVQMSLSTPASQTDGQSQGRPSRRSKASGPCKEMSQSDAQLTLSTPASETDSQSQGRPSRRSKVCGPSEEMSQSDAQMTLSKPASQTEGHSQGRPSRRSKASGPSEEMSQSDALITLSTSVSQADGQSQGRPSRRSKALEPSEEMSQSDAQITLSTAVSQADGQSQGRTSRRSKALEPSEEMSQSDAQITLSTSVSEADGQSQGRTSRRSKALEPSKEMSQSDAQITLSTPVSQTDTQTSLSSSINQDVAQSERRLSRSKVAGTSAAEMSQTDSQIGLTEPRDQNGCQLQSRSTCNSKATDPTEGVSQTDLHTAIPTDSQSQDTPSIMSKITAELNVSYSVCATSAIQSEHSHFADEGEGTQESPHNLGLCKMSGFSQGLSSGIENSELDVSKASADGQKSWKRGRKRKLLNSKAKPQNPLKTQKMPEGSDQIVAMEISPEVEMENCSLGHNSESKSILVNAEAETVEQSEEKENKHLSEIMAPDGMVNPAVESKAELESASEAFANVASEMQVEISKPSMDPSIEISDLPANHLKVLTKRGRGRPRCRGSNSRKTPTAASDRETLSQESDILDLQVTNSQGLGEIIIPPDPEPPSDSKEICPQPENALAQPQNDAELNDDVFLEPNAASTPTLPECLPAGALSVTETTTGNTTAEEMWNTCHSEVQLAVAVSEQVEDMKEGQEQDIDVLQVTDVPQVTDVTESTIAPAQEQAGEEISVVQEQGINGEEDFASVQEQDAGKEVVVLEAVEEDNITQMDSDIPIAAVDTTIFQTLPEAPPFPQLMAAEPPCLDSPPKQKHLDAVVGEMGQSPSSGKTKGVWSPSASPSTSILKKGQKRPLEVESPSPLQKSRRVSFADPIHHQELADDIDRRSPVVRPSAGSSPRSKNMVTISSQQKFVTTPTKGMLTPSPRNLRSPGYKSSKKCLISEMSQEPKPIPKDSVYPALVSCSTPVEAVLPQISSNMWPRGFGQLVRARNIRTVGDLSALTPTEIKSLPIRSPKLSNVKKALRNYHEQQRKGRSDELKGFDEMEKMTSEPEETEMTQHQEEGNPPEEQVTESPDVLAPPAPVEQRPVELLSAVETLGARLNPEELGQCTPGQLVLMHEQLGGMMRAIVVQLQARLSPSPGESIP